jgi:phosphoserine phosphatase
MDATTIASALPSWRPGAASQSIVDFLHSVTEGPDAVPPEQRLATFDNDGTLACEKPRTALAAFLAQESGGASGDVAGGHEVLRELGALFAGRSTSEYERRSRAFLDEARHPRFDRGYEALVYAPMRELIDLLHTLEFSVFLCSDSSRDFNRVLAAPAYGLPRERVIGSEVQIELRDGRLVRTASPAPLDDGPGKVVHIWDRTGQRPLLAAGNAAGDIEMLTAARFALLVHHDDPELEYAYDDEPALAAAAKAGWSVISMREDFAALWVSPSRGATP